MKPPCAGKTRLFFVDTVTDALAEGHPTVAAARDAAHRICQGCPKRQDCLSGAIERQEPAGVWGGVWFPTEARRAARRRAEATQMIAQAQSSATTNEEVA